jgi:hypothetical protein
MKCTSNILYARDLGAPDSPFLETQVDPTTWQCLNVLLPGWTFALEEKNNTFLHLLQEM